jgi:segregation and condensation protein B
MKKTTSIDNLVRDVGAVLFASSRPVSTQKIVNVTASSTESVLSALEVLKERVAELNIGVGLFEVADGWQLRSTPDAAEVMERLFPERNKKLSRAALETLAIIAYRQPVMRSEIESIRGVDSSYTIKTLVDAGLISVIGREDSPGNPPLFSTTKYFLEKFGLKDLTQLPTEGELEDVLEEQNT